MLFVSQDLARLTCLLIIFVLETAIMANCLTSGVITINIAPMVLLFLFLPLALTLFLIAAPTPMVVAA